MLLYILSSYSITRPTMYYCTLLACQGAIDNSTDLDTVSIVAGGGCNHTLYIHTPYVSSNHESEQPSNCRHSLGYHGVD